MRLTLPPILAAGYGLSLAAASGLLRADSRFIVQPGLLRAVVLFFLPAAATAIWLVLEALMRRGPCDSRSGAVVRTIALHVLWFLTAIHVLLVAALCGVGWVPPVAGRAVVVSVGLALVAIGNELPRTRPNIAIGIRTARALSDRDLWMRLHRTLGHAMVLIGALTIYAGLLLHATQMAAVPVVAIGATALWMSGVYWVEARADSRAWLA